MQAYEMLTDDSLRSTMQYGTATFPFSYYLDDMQQYKGQRIGWHWHDELEFSVILSGMAACQIGTERISLSSGDGLFINSGTIHSFVSVDRGILLHIIFSPEFFAVKGSDIYRKYIQPVLLASYPYGAFYSNDQGWAEMRDCIHKIYQSTRSEHPARELQICIQTLILWARFLENVKAELQAGAPKVERLIQARLHKMMDFIHQNFAKPLSLCDIAAAANISKSEVLRCFHLGINTTPISYLNAYRLQQAKNLLQTTTCTVTAVSMMVGFENAGYFGRVFKKRYGCTPNEFRKSQSLCP